MSSQNLKARVSLAGFGTYECPEYSCRISPSVIPFYVELLFTFHAIGRFDLYMWCADEEDDPTLLSIEQKDAAYAHLMKIMETEHDGVEEIVAKLQRTSTRPEAELRAMAVEIDNREWQKEVDAIDALWAHIHQALAKTDTGSITDISLEDAKIVAKGVMDTHLVPSALNPYIRLPELVPTKVGEEQEVEKSVAGKEKEEEAKKKPGKNAKRNAARKAARKVKRGEQKAADMDLAEGSGEGGSVTSNQF